MRDLDRILETAFLEQLDLIDFVASAAMYHYLKQRRDEKVCLFFNISFLEYGL